MKDILSVEGNALKEEACSGGNGCRFLMGEGEMGNQTNESVLILYDCCEKQFIYPKDIRNQINAAFDTRPLWDILQGDGVVSEVVAREIQEKILEMQCSGKPDVYFTEYFVKTSRYCGKWYRVGFICPVPGDRIFITFTDMVKESAMMSKRIHMSDLDQLTGLLNKNAFDRVVEQMLFQKTGTGEGYALVYFDFIRFKAVNDVYGMAEGDRLLKYIAASIINAVKPEDVVCHLGADHYVLFTRCSHKGLECLLERFSQDISRYHLPLEIAYNAGIYMTTQEKLSTNAMIDRAVLALAAIKGSYTSKYKYYSDELRYEMLRLQEISGVMKTALAEEQFVVYYQPQFSYVTGQMVGAEALVRWEHPEKGFILPGLFIPIFEKNGFITNLDRYVFEKVCIFQRNCMDNGLFTVPISVNFSGVDVLQQDFVENLEEIRNKYKIPIAYLRIEITESAIMGVSQKVGRIIRKLHKCGYVVEMDDFGSGYSSLNVLKDIDIDMIKLDMLFLSQNENPDKADIILSAVVLMANRLGIPVIAEGVERVEQADFLCDIGCDYMQGYLYSKPLQQKQYLELIVKKTKTML